MKEKIEWYQEVLEIEPNSRIFFPLAKMLVADGQNERAIATLREGTGRHPDFVEARLLLVDLLYQQGSRPALEQEVDRVAKLFVEYPNFWQAWGQNMEKGGEGRDASLALSFLAAAMQAKGVTWADVIEQGLRQVFSPVGPESGDRRGPEIRQAKARVSVRKHEAAPVQEKTECAPMTQVEPEALSSPVDTTDEDDADESLSLRTRSMAEVLAQQGDFSGAVEIYRELMDHADDEAEKASLAGRLNELTRQQSTQAEPATADSGPEETAPKGNARLAEMLEELALRLEERSI